MTIKYDYSGKLSGGDETYVDTREGITELVDGLSEQLLYFRISSRTRSRSFCSILSLSISKMSCMF